MLQEKPMTELYTDERQELAGSVRAACEKFASEERVRAASYGNGSCGGVDTELWTVLCAQVGVAQIALPEHVGGAGYGASALGVVAHELGRVLAPVPFVASAGMATGLLPHPHPARQATEKRLPGLFDGRRTAAAALTGNGGFWRRAAVTLTAARSGDDWSVDGVVRHVLNGRAA